MQTVEKLDLSKVTNVEIDGIDYSDYPDFCDAYITNALYDGEEVTPEQLEMLNNDTQFVYDEVIKHIF
jgi:hypothetical protein